jgi:hypothetical protein
MLWEKVEREKAESAKEGECDISSRRRLSFLLS